MPMKKILLSLLFISSTICHAQDFRPLEMLKGAKYCKYMKSSRIFFRETNNLLFSCSRGSGYFFFDTTGTIHPITIEDEFVPISFFSGDTLLVRHSPTNQYLFYDINQQEYTDIGQPPFLSLLTVISQEDFNGMVLDSTLTSGIWWNDTALFVVSLNTDISHKTETNVILCVHNDSHITGVFPFSDKYVFINIFDVPRMAEHTCIFSLDERCIADSNCGFLVNDCRGNSCIAWRDGECAIWKVDKTASFILKIRDISAYTTLHGRLGFVSQNIIAWYTREACDYSTFEPILNQQRLLKIR